MPSKHWTALDELRATTKTLAIASGDADALSIKSLIRKGFDSTDGETVTYKGAPVFPASALTEESPEADLWRQQTRISLDDAYKGAFVGWLREAVKWGDGDAAMNMLPQLGKSLLGSAWVKGLANNPDNVGGFAVPLDMASAIIARRAEASVFARRARTIPTVRDQLRVPRFQAHASNGSVYSSSFVGGWVGETETHSDDDPAFGTVDIPIRKLRVTTKLSRDLADDVPEMISALVADGGANMAVLRDAAFIAGDGMTQPLGLLSGGASTVDIEGSTANTVSNTSAAAGSAPKLLDLAYGLPSQYSRNAVWLMKNATQKAVRKLVDGDNRRSFPRDASNTIEGFGVEVSDGMPADGSDGNKPIVFGDLSSYIVAERAMLSVIVLRERYADQTQVGLVIFDRVGGMLGNPDGVRIGVV